MNTKPYKASGMKPMSPYGVCNKGEIAMDKMEGQTKPAKRPSKIGTSGAMHDGPYGGKKPESRK